MSGATANAPPRAIESICFDQDSAPSGKPWRRITISPLAGPSAIARSADRWPGPCSGWRSPHILSDEIRCSVKRLVENCEQTVPLTLENLETSVGDQLDLVLQQLDAGERIAIAAQKYSRAADLAPVVGAELVGEARTVQRIREKDESTEVRLDRCHARDPSTEGLTTTDDLMTST